MNLLDIKHYLSQVKISSLATLASYFKCERDVLRHMLEHWVRKGSVRKFTQTKACGGPCSTCGSCSTEIYEWLAI